MTNDEWRKDLAFFKKQLLEYHKEPFNYVIEKEFNKKYQRLYNKIPKLEDDQIKVRLIELGALIGDGHTNIRPYDSFDSFPVRYFWFNNELRIIKVDKENKIALGGIVERIGAHPVKKAFEKVQNLIPRNESKTFVLGWSQALMRMSEPLYALGIIKSKTVLPLTIRRDDGSKVRIEILLKEYLYEDLISAYPIPPKFLNEQSKPYFEWLSENRKILYFNFETYPEWSDLKDFGMRLISFIANNHVKVLVVDLRRNGGGDFNKGLRLIEELNKRTDFNQKGKTYVLIGRDTFSAGMSNASHFKGLMGGILVGEITGARPNGYQENHNFILPHSKIPGSVAKEYYQFSDRDTPGILPDIEILPDYHLYVKGRDPVIDWILAQKR